MSEQVKDVELGWDDAVTEDAPEYVLLPEGDYDFEVTGFEKGRYPGGDKIGPCNKAIIKITLKNDKGICVINHNLFMVKRLESMVSEFLCGIGQKKRGETLQPNWNRIVGCTGRAKVVIEPYNGNDYNKIKKFYPKEYTPYQAGKF